MLNSVGLQGPGLAAWVADDLPALAASGARVVVSIWGRSVSDYERAAELVAAAASTARGPASWRSRSTSAVPTWRTGRACSPTRPRRRRGSWRPPRAACPRWAKLSPNVPDVVEIAAGALEGGADGLTLVNTLLGLALDAESGRPVLGAGGGGLSGAAVHPVAVRAVWECRTAFPEAADRRGGRGDRRAATRSSCSWPVPTPCRSARPSSGTPGRRGRCSASWRAGATPTGRRWARSATTRGAGPAAVGRRRPRAGSTAGRLAAGPTAASVPLLNEGGRDG